MFEMQLIDFSLPYWLVLLLVFLLSSLITFVSIPPIVRIAKVKGLVDIPNSRSSHKEPVPSFGGISLFASAVISWIIFAPSESSSIMIYMIGGLLIIFFLGLKDDIFSLDPMKKLLGQVVAASIYILFSREILPGFFGFLEISHLPPMAGYVATLLVFLVLINGFNLIDGVDGLASGIGILCLLLFLVVFLVTGDQFMAIISFGLVGGLMVFFIYNVFGRTNKIFLGDTGAMILGFMVSVFVIRIVRRMSGTEFPEFLGCNPAVVLAVIIIPVFDTARVFLLRLIDGKSPIEPDKNHIHHRLLDLNLSHIVTTTVLVTLNIFVVVVSFLLCRININLLVVVVFSIPVLFFLLVKGIRK